MPASMGGYDQTSNEMAIFLKKALRIEGPQLSQKVVTIRKNARESLGMRIGGGIGSNEGDTPIYIANIHPHGCIGKSKQMKVKQYKVNKVWGKYLYTFTYIQFKQKYTKICPHTLIIL